MQFTFLICSERSGSNLLTRMIDGHSLYCGPSPLHAFRILGEALPGYGDLARDDNWSRLVDDCAELIQSQIGVWRTRWSARRLRAEVPERSLVALLRHIYSAEATAHGKKRVLIKEIGVHRFLPYLLAAFPLAQYVHLVRDPRDMALSWKCSPTHRGGVLRAAAVWREEQAAAMNILAWLGDVRRIHRLHYETLVRDPRASLAAVCRFLNVVFEHTMLDFHRNGLTRDNAGRTDNWRNLSVPVIGDNSGKFRRGLTEDEIRYIEGLCHREMKAFGYGPELEPASDLDGLQARLELSEPVTKPAYAALDAEERRRRGRWQAVVARIRSVGPAEVAP